MADTLEKLRKTLYERGEIAERKERDTLSELKSYALKKTPASGWATTGRPPRSSLARNTKLLILAGAAALIAIIVATIYLFGGFGGGENNIVLSLSAAESVAGGEKVGWRVTIENKNPLTIEGADLIFEYPAGSQPESKRAKTPLSSLLIERRAIGPIVSGEILNEEFEAFVFGDAGNGVRARATLEYRLEGSSALLYKEIFFDTLITRTPLSVAVTLPEYANIGQELEFEVLISSSAKDEIMGLTATLNYPDGFEFVSAVPAPSVGTSTWQLPALFPNEVQKVRVRGKIFGEGLENKVFKAAVGVKDGRSGKFTSYGSGTGTIALRRQFLDVAVMIDGQKEAVVSPGEQVDVVIRWSNNLPVEARKAVLEIKLEGAALDLSRVDVERGFFRGSDSTAVWNASSYPAFLNISPGGSGELKMRLMIARTPLVRESEDVNFIVKLSGRMYLGERPAGFEGVDIEGRFAMNVKVSSSLQLSRQGYYYHEMLPNSGSLPPRVGEKTTYTVVWSLSNSTNNAEEVTVSANLPAYISWEGKFISTEENISYDSLTGQVVWRTGTLAAGVGLIRPARTVAFQIGLVPSESQVGSSPELMLESTVTGKDSFTGAALSDRKSPLNINLYNDTRIKYDQMKVIK